MATLSQRRTTMVAMEENTLAILDSAEAKDTQDANDDRIAYLSAVRLASILSDSPSPSTNKMVEAVFQILRGGKSLESIMESFRLLNELDNRYPPVYVSNERSPVLVVVEEAWSPFGFCSDVARCDKNPAAEIRSGPIDASGFHLLIQDLVEVADEANFHASDLKAISRMFLFQYIVNALEGDFVPRNCVYKETMHWNLLRESFLNMLLGSRRISYKSLLKDCLSIICALFQISDNFESSENPEAASGKCDDYALAIAVLEARKTTCIAMGKFLTIIMELDMSKNKAEMQGCTTRADGVRTPLLEIILDELTYDQDMLSQFLRAFAEPKWKLEIILQYLSKYTAKPSVRTRRSNGCTDNVTFNGVLKLLMDSTSSRNILKKIGAEVVQLLVAHAFQAHLSRSCQNLDGIVDSDEEVKATPLTEICKNFVSSFRSLRRMAGKMDILPVGKEALFTAASILSTKS